MDFGTFNPVVYKQLFRPRREVLLKVTAYERHFSPYTIGMHIRRTDHAFSIAHSPTSLFLQAAEIELKQHPDMKLFLATDSEAVKREFIEMFGSHVLTSGVEADRNSREGLVDGLAELWTLSRTCKIYGSLGSTFSQMAAYIGGKKKELIYLRKDSPGRLLKNTR